MDGQDSVVTTTEIRLEERLALHRSTLSPRELEVAEHLALHREDVAFLTAAEIAARLGTSDATVVRTVKSLGYPGMQALRTELLDELRARASPAARLERSFEQLGPEGSVLDHVLGLQIELLDEMRRSIRLEQFVRAVDTLDRAQRVVVAAIGPSAGLAEYLTLRLRRFRRPASTIAATGLRLADELLGMRAGDVVLLVAYEHLDGDSGAVIERANELDVPVVLVTDTLGAALADRIEVSLVAPRSRAGALSTVATTVALFDALLLELATRDRAGALAALDELAHLRERTTGRPAQPERDWHDVLTGGDGGAA